MTTTRKKCGALIAALVSLVAVGELTGEGPLLLGGGEAHAIVGRPLTPMSYAGVARRTTRRAVYAGAAYHGAYGGYYAAPSAGYVTTLPTGCGQAIVNGVAVYQCGTVAYRPYYSGGVVVYRPY